MVLALAHYFPPYPLQLTAAAYPADHYATAYLVPGGDPASSTVYGGLLRDRPLPPGPLTGDWALANARDEVAQARSAGLDGFLVDILTPTTSGGNNNSRFGNAIFDAAAVPGITAPARSAVPVPEVATGTRITVTSPHVVTHTPYVQDMCYTATG